MSEDRRRTNMLVQRKKTKRGNTSVDSNSGHTRKSKQRDRVRDDLKFSSLLYGSNGDFDVETTVDQVVVSPLVEATAFSAVSLAFVQLFIARGGQFTSDNPSAPYHAFIYMADTLKTLANGGKPEMARAPKVYSDLAAKFMRKLPNKANGKNSYSFDINGDVDMSNLLDTGPTTAVGKINLGVKDTTTYVNLVIPCTMPPVAYTEELGEASTNEVFDFLAKKTDDTRFKIVDFPPTENVANTDSSAYAYSLGVVGGGQYATGGLFKTLALEVPIWSPLVSGAVRFTTGANIGRAASKVKTFSGDLTSSTACMMTMYKRIQYQSDRVQNFKYYDFDEVNDVLFRAYTLAIQAEVLTEEFATNFAKDPNYYISRVQYPLSMQNARILNRSMVMNYNAEGQLIASTVYPSEELGAGVVMRPLVCGVGQGPYGGVNATNYPQSMSEYMAQTRSKLVTPPEWKRNPKAMIACWGLFTNNTLDTKDYRVFFPSDDGIVELPVFFQPQVESTIDLVDGKVGAKYVMLNDPSFLNGFVKLHNDWLETNGEWFVPISPMNVEPGVSLLSTIGKSEFVVEQLEREESTINLYIPGAEDMTTTELADYRKKLLAGRRNITDTPIVNVYDFRGVIVTSNYDKPLSNVDTGPGAFSFVPKYFVQAPVNNQDNNLPQTMQGYTDEVFTSPEAEGSADFPTLGDRHQQMALTMIRNERAPLSSLTNFYNQMSADGEGGVLGDLVGTVGSTLVRAGGDVLTETLASGVERLSGVIGV